MPKYDPNSTDASFARLFQRMDTQDDTLKRIEDRVTIQNGKVSALEKEKWLHRGFSFSGFMAACHHVLMQVLGK